MEGSASPHRQLTYTAWQGDGFALRLEIWHGLFFVHFDLDRQLTPSLLRTIKKAWIGVQGKLAAIGVHRIHAHFLCPVEPIKINLAKRAGMSQSYNDGARIIFVKDF